jgi:hypothetical protein
MAVVVPVMSPVHFLRLETIDLVAGRNGGVGDYAGGWHSSALDEMVRR